MKRVCMVPPECCVVVEMEEGARLGYRRAVLLKEIDTQGSLDRAARLSRIEFHHAKELILEMNAAFSQPLVQLGEPVEESDRAVLTAKGQETVARYWRHYARQRRRQLQEQARYY